MKQKVTIQDIANMVNVSKSSVSRYLNNGYVSEENAKKIKEAMNLNSDSVVLIFSTEGNTDPIGYDEIIYDGKNPSSFVEGR